MRTPLRHPGRRCQRAPEQWTRRDRTEEDTPMAAFTRSDDLQGSNFVGANLRGARFVESDLSGAVMRGVEVAHADIDAPWLPHGDYFLVNGVDVIPYVE